ncbi:MAG: hypothetical protein WD361_04865, partial [Gracilimonas sp.]
EGGLYSGGFCKLLKLNSITYPVNSLLEERPTNSAVPEFVVRGVFTKASRILYVPKSFFVRNSILTALTKKKSNEQK